MTIAVEVNKIQKAVVNNLVGISQLESHMMIDRSVIYLLHACYGFCGGGKCHYSSLSLRPRMIN